MNPHALNPESLQPRTLMTLNPEPSYPEPLQVLLCYNQLMTDTEVENTMAHELIHAYDYCRRAVVDFAHLPEHACTEVNV